MKEWLSLHGRRSIIGISVAFAIALGSGLTLAVALSGESNRPPLGNAIASGKLRQFEHALSSGGTESTVAAPAPAMVLDRIPAHLLGPDVQVPLSPALIDVANGWLVSDGKTLVAVYAGAAGDNSSKGRFVIVRQNLLLGRQTMDVVDVPGTGSVTITDAPKGAGVETVAQHGEIGFHSARSKSGDLDLTTDVPSSP